MLIGFYYCHDVKFKLFMPVYFGVSKICAIYIYDWVFSIFLKSHSIVMTKCYRLLLDVWPICIHSCIKCYYWFILKLNRRAWKYHYPILLAYCKILFIPSKKIIWSSMAPTHMPPFCSIRVILIIEIVGWSIEVVKKSIWVIHPVFIRSVMEMRSILLRWCYSL